MSLLKLTLSLACIVVFSVPFRANAQSPQCLSECQGVLQSCEQTRKPSERQNKCVLLQATCLMRCKGPWTQQDFDQIRAQPSQVD